MRKEVSKILTILLGLLVFALLCYLCIGGHASQILADNAAVAVGTDTPPGVVFGVSSFKAETQDGKMVLTGVLPDPATKEHILVRAREVYGVDHFVDHLTMDDKVAPPSWLSDILALMSFTVNEVKNGGLSVEENRISLTGQVSSEVVKESLFKAASLVSRNFTLNNLLRVGPDTDAVFVPPFKAEAQDGKMVLSGVLPDIATRDQILARAREVYGVDNFFAHFTIDFKVARPSWLFDLLGLMRFTTLEEVKNGGLSVEKKSISLTGQVPSEAVKERIFKEASLVSQNFTLNNLLTVGPATVTDEQATTQIQINEQLVGKVVEFDTDSAELTPLGKAVLDELVPIFRENPNVNFEIGGHTDSRADDAHNLNLSERRAATVKKYLASEGLTEARFTTRGYGETQPLASNDTEEGMQRNRRIGFTLREGKKS
jgi:OOP family OmpA-OmpF porin